jgi:3,4-dihydroxy 2-butanone 4-phosphate synthase/GTP cyclohydrolase II
MNDDGTMARLPDLQEFAKEHDLKIGTIADLIHYRILNERTIDEIDAPVLHTKAGEFEVKAYHDNITGGTHLALSKGGPFKEDEPTLVRVHVTSTLKDLLGVHVPGRSSWTLDAAMAKVSEEGTGVVVLLDVQESIDVETELCQLSGDKKQPKNPNVDKYGTYNTIGTGSQILRDLGVGKMRLLSSPTRFGGISGFDLEVIEFIEPK